MIECFGKNYSWIYSQEEKFKIEGAYSFEELFNFNKSMHHRASMKGTLCWAHQGTI